MPGLSRYGGWGNGAPRSGPPSQGSSSAMGLYLAAGPFPVENSEGGVRKGIRKKRVEEEINNMRKNTL